MKNTCLEMLYVFILVNGELLFITVNSIVQNKLINQNLFSSQTVKHLRTYEFKPFVIFIKPPSLDRLRETRKNAKIISSKDDKGTAKPFTVSIIRHGKT